MKLMAREGSLAKTILRVEGDLMRDKMLGLWSSNVEIAIDERGRQRNLTERGREEARAIGARMRRLEIPIGDVLASPFCRTRESAELIFGRARVDARVRGGPARPDDPQRYAVLRLLLATPVAGGRNLAIVSHGNPFRALAGPPYLAEGEAAVVEPLGDRGFRIVAKIRPDGWDALSP